MGQVIHYRRGNFRIWSTFVDQYVTEPMTEASMEAWLKNDARSAALEYEAGLVADIKNRMERARRKGTSSLVGGERDKSTWETERCNRCGTFHHTFDLRSSDGNCGHCGEPEGDVAHKPPCEDPPSP